MENNFFSEGGAKFEGHGFATAAGRRGESRDKEQQTGQLLLKLVKTRDTTNWSTSNIVENTRQSPLDAPKSVVKGET